MRFDLGSDKVRSEPEVSAMPSKSPAKKRPAKKRVTKKRVTKKQTAAKRPKKAAKKTTRKTRPAKRKAARKAESPAGLTPAIKHTIVEALKIGHFRTMAARLAGLDKRTITRWMSDGEKPDATKKLREFVRDVRAAEAEACDTGVKALHGLVKGGDRQAIKLFLSKKDPEWGDEAKRALKAAMDAMVEVIEDELEPDVARRVRAALASRLTRAGGR